MKKSDNNRCPECGYEIFIPETVNVTELHCNTYRVENVVKCSDCGTLYIIGTSIEEGE